MHDEDDDPDFEDEEVVSERTVDAEAPQPERSRRSPRRGRPT